MNRRPLALPAPVVAILALSLLGGCPKSSNQRIDDAAKKGPKAPVRLPPVSQDALREFERGMAALRLASRKPSPDAYEKAKERLQAAVELEAKLWEAWHNIGIVHYRQGDDGEAAQAFSKALEINPAHIESVLARAEAHRRAGKIKAARSDYEKAVGQSDDNTAQKRNATARLASLLRESRQYDDALAVIRNTLRTSGANAKVYVELGMLYMAQGRDELADLVLAKAIELDAKEPSIYNAQALLALSRGKSQDAFDRFDYATSLAPNYVDARFNKAKVLIDVGDYKRAESELQKVVEASPDDLDALLALGLAQRGTGEFKKAKGTWDKVVARAPMRSHLRADAMYNLALLQFNFLEDEKAAATAFAAFLAQAPIDHPKRKDAEEKQKELGVSAPAEETTP